jgi:hypothetical protein
MKKVNLKGRLTLTKEIVSNLKNSEMKNVNGGTGNSCIVICIVPKTKDFFTCKC